MKVPIAPARGTPKASAGMRLVYLSPVPLASFAQRPHHFVRWFHERFDATVTWIEPYPARLPRATDLRRLRRPAGPPLGPDWRDVRRQPLVAPWSVCWDAAASVLVVGDGSQLKSVRDRVESLNEHWLETDARLR